MTSQKYHSNIAHQFVESTDSIVYSSVRKSGLYYTSWMWTTIIVGYLYDNNIQSCVIMKFYNKYDSMQYIYKWIFTTPHYLCGNQLLWTMLSQSWWRMPNVGMHSQYGPLESSILNSVSIL